MIFQNDTLQFIQTAEGRLVPRRVEHSNDFEYQYHLKDHLGNVRTTFAVRDDHFNTSFETVENPYFDNYEQIEIIANPMAKTGGSSNRIASFGQGAERIGITKSFLVSEGDQVNASVYAKYLDITDPNETVNALPLINALAGMLSAGTFGLENPVSNTSLTDGMTGLAASGTSDDSQPQAYFNYILLDKSFNYVQGGFKQLTTAAADDGTGSGTHELLAFENFTIPQDGYIMFFVSNESETLTEVYFDDLMIHHHKTEVIQASDYMPFGLEINAYVKEYSTIQNYKYNGFEEQVDWGVYDYQARFYDPGLGRFMNVDPMADLMRRHSAYNYAFDNPIRFIDPDGMIPEEINEINNKVDPNDLNARMAERSPWLLYWGKCPTCPDTERYDGAREDDENYVYDEKTGEYALEGYEYLLNSNKQNGGGELHWFWRTHAGRDISDLGKSIKQFFRQKGGVVMIDTDGNKTSDLIGPSNIENFTIIENFNLAFPTYSPNNILERSQYLSESLIRIFGVTPTDDTTWHTSGGGYTIQDTMYIYYPDSMKIAPNDEGTYLEKNKIIWD